MSIPPQSPENVVFSVGFVGMAVAIPILVHLPSPILPFPDASPGAVVNGSGSQAYPYILVIQTVP